MIDKKKNWVIVTYAEKDNCGTHWTFKEDQFDEYKHLLDTMRANFGTNRVIDCGDPLNTEEAPFILLSMKNIVALKAYKNEYFEYETTEATPDDGQGELDLEPKETVASKTAPLPKPKLTPKAGAFVPKAK